MNRKAFIQISATALLPIALGLFPKWREVDEESFTLTVDSNRKFGHLLREKSRTSVSQEESHDIVVVGGGVAGLSAAWHLRERDVVVLEAGASFGGTSGSGNWKDVQFATGAHYELAYPQNFSSEVIESLVELGVLKYNYVSDLYDFVDEKFVIRKKEQEQCFYQGDVLPDVMGDLELKEEEVFYAILENYVGTMPLPTHEIQPEYHELNAVSFAAFLAEKMTVSPELKRRLDYQMLDDWGGTTDQVSALAGIHYFMCRPYDELDVPLFSPPHGNQYFVEKMIGGMTELDALRCNALVRAVIPNETGVRVEYINQAGDVTAIQAKKVVFAAPKHLLKYVIPSADTRFTHQTAPWVSLNLVCKSGLNLEKWQNDVVTEDLRFLGFVNSAKQHRRGEVHDVLTLYYCYGAEERERLVAIENSPREFVEKSIALLQKEIGDAFQPEIVHAQLTLMGHAMPIPAPNYLRLTKSPPRDGEVIYAGVDCGRLPLFSEAFDSGLQAAKVIRKELSETEQISLPS